MVAQSHPLAQKPLLGLAELAELPLLARAGNGGVLRAIDVIGRSLPRNIKLNVMATFDSFETLRVAVKGGMGVGVMWEDLVVDDLREGSLKTLTATGINLNSHTSLVYLRDSVLSSIAAHFVEFVRLCRDKEPAIANPIQLDGKRDVSRGSIGRRKHLNGDDRDIRKKHLRFAT